MTCHVNFLVTLFVLDTWFNKSLSGLAVSMKTRKGKDSLKNLTKLSTSRITNRTQSYGNSANSLFGPRKNVFVTYSKSRPIRNIMKKYHFHSPDTPHVSTPDSLQTTGKDQASNLEDKSKELDSHGKGGSYTLQKTQLSLKNSNIKPSTPVSTVKPTLALRNISNIPIDKTLSRTQCTPRQEDNRTAQPSSKQPAKAKKKLTPFNSKLKDIRFPKNNGRKKLLMDSLKMNEDDETPKSKFSTIKDEETVASLIENEDNYLQVEMCQRNSTLKQKSKSPRARSAVDKDSTDYSIKSMSTDSDVRTKSNNSPVNTLTAGSMSFCTMVEVKGDSAQSMDKNLPQENFSSIQYNSTFNEDVENVYFKDYFKELLSPIKEDDKHEQPEGNDTGASQAAVIAQHIDNTKRDMICTDAPRTSTPVDEGKTNTAHIDEPGISPITKDCHNEFVTKPEEIEMPGVSPITKDNKSTKTQNSKMEIRKEKNISNKETSSNTSSKSIPMQTKKKHDKNKDINEENYRNTSTSSPSKTKKKHENSKNTSLPLQASICIEDDSDKESIPDNITPEVIPHIKSQCSSSKRKLEYTDMPFKPNTQQCILQDFPCTVKKSCNYKVWIKNPLQKSHKNVSAIKNHTFPLDILKKVYH